MSARFIVQCLADNTLDKDICKQKTPLIKAKLIAEKHKMYNYVQFTNCV